MLARTTYCCSTGSKKRDILIVQLIGPTRVMTISLLYGNNHSVLLEWITADKNVFYDSLGHSGTHSLVHDEDSTQE